MAGPRNKHGPPSPRAGEGRPSQTRGRGEGSSKKILVARIGAAHGVRGEVKLWPFTEDPMAVADYGPLETEDGRRQFKITSARPAKGHLIARLSGVDDRNAAELLRNIDLFVPRDRLPPLEDDDAYYYADLIGLTAVTPDGAPLGTVLALHNFGAGDVIEIQPAGGGQTMMLPFTEAAVPEVDVEGGRITVVAPAEVSIPPLKGEGHPPERSDGGRGRVDDCEPE